MFLIGRIPNNVIFALVLRICELHKVVIHDLLIERLKGHDGLEVFETKIITNEKPGNVVFCIELSPIFEMVNLCDFKIHL